MAEDTIRMIHSDISNKKSKIGEEIKQQYIGVRYLIGEKDK